MKLKVIAVLALMACGVTAYADYLYWMTPASGDAKFETGGSIAYSYAQIYSGTYSSGTSGTALGLTADTTSGATASVNKLSAGSGAWASNVGTGSDDSIYVILYDASGTEVAHSEGVAYANYKDYVEIAEFGQNWQGMAVTTPFSIFTYVPEPTSGLLMLVGAALLGLRRKRVA